MFKSKNTGKDKGLAVARARLFEWGSCIRAVALSGAPHPHCYSKQPFVNERVNFDFSSVSREIFAGKRFDRAIEVEELLEPIKKDTPRMYAALVVRYIEREPGAGNRKLRQEDQFFRWNSKTGLGKNAYYARLHKAEKYLTIALGS